MAADPVELDVAVAVLIERVLRAPSAFYRRRLRSAGIERGTDATAAALRRVPLTRRAELVEDQLAAPPFGTRRCADAPWPVRAGTTGTGADLLLLAGSAADLARERAVGARLLGRFGIAAGTRVASALPGALATPGALLFGDVVEELGGLDVPLGAVASEDEATRAWELMDLVGPAVLVVDTATAGRLFAAVPARPRPWWRLLVWLDRRGDAAALPVPVAAGFGSQQRRWLAVAEVSSFVAWSCTAGRLQVDPNLVAEVLEESGRSPVQPGGTGLLVLTSVDADLPVLRYDTGITAGVPSGPACPCGQIEPGLEIPGLPAPTIHSRDSDST